MRTGHRVIVGKAQDERNNDRRQHEDRVQNRGRQYEKIAGASLRSRQIGFSSRDHLHRNRPRRRPRPRRFVSSLGTLVLSANKNQSFVTSDPGGKHLFEDEDSLPAIVFLPDNHTR